MNNFSKVLVAGVFLIIAGCASAPEPSPMLQEATAAYEAAKANEEVLRYASDNLEEAERTLQAAEAAGKDREQMDSLAYVASAQITTAEAVARRQVADDRIQELNAIKDSVQLEAREAELAASQAQLAALQAKKTSRGTVVTLGSVLFATGKSELLPGAQGSVDRLGAYLADNEDKTVLIEGHTDSTGSDTTNLRLSQERADAVRTALIMEGINKDRVVATGLGSSRPVASNDTAAGRQQNRRVEIIIQ